jgi:hypothetical protein
LLADVGKAVVEILGLVQARLTELVIEPAMARDGERAQRLDRLRNPAGLGRPDPESLARPSTAKEIRSSQHMELNGLELVGAEVVKTMVVLAHGAGRQ